MVVIAAMKTETEGATMTIVGGEGTVPGSPGLTGSSVAARARPTGDLMIVIVEVASAEMTAAMVDVMAVAMTVMAVMVAAAAWSWTLLMQDASTRRGPSASVMALSCLPPALAPATAPPTGWL
jgi:hypothetical protein